MKTNRQKEAQYRTWENRHVVVVGMGKSGQSAAVLANVLGARVTCFDQRLIDTNLQNSLQSRVSELSSTVNSTISFQQGHPVFSSSVADYIDILIVSPGIPAASSWLVQLQESHQKYHKKELEIASEVGFAASQTKTPIIAITGTNGKSSSCWYIHQYLSFLGYRSFVGGNFGTALSEMVLEESVLSKKEQVPYDYAIVEISSYQMEFPYGFRPHVGVILNLTPDHLARHKTMEVYAEMKKRIFAFQTAEDFCLYPLKNDLLIPTNIDSKPVIFCDQKPLCNPTPKAPYLYIDCRDQKHQIIWTDEAQCEHIFELPPLQLLGRHNIQNIQTMLGIVCCLSLPIDLELIQKIRPLEHRLEIVTLENKDDISIPSNVLWINDSKATNVEATQAGIRATIEYLQQSNSSVSTDLFILLGGAGKEGANYEVLLDDLWNVLEDIRITIICFGASASVIEEQLTPKIQERTHIEIVVTKTMEKAMFFCHKNSDSHQRYNTAEKSVILLSPSCASFDAFDNFEHRGRVFSEIVEGFYSSAQQNISSSILPEAT